MNIRIIGFPDELEQHLPYLRAALPEHQIGGPGPVDPDFPGASQGIAVQYTIVTELTGARETSRGGYTCPFSRCRTPFATFAELDQHMTLTRDPLNHTHNVDIFSPQELIAEVRHLLDSCLRLEQSCGHYKAVADSYIAAVHRACAPVRAGGVCGV